MQWCIMGLRASSHIPSFLSLPTTPVPPVTHNTEATTVVIKRSRSLFMTRHEKPVSKDATLLRQSSEKRGKKAGLLVAEVEKAGGGADTTGHLCSSRWGLTSECFPWFWVKLQCPGLRVQLWLCCLQRLRLKTAAEARRATHGPRLRRREGRM